LRGGRRRRPGPGPRARAERELALRDARLRGLADSAGAGVALTDLEGRFTFVNRALCELAGCEEGELIGRNFADFLHPDDLGPLMGLFLRGHDEPEAPAQVEFRVARKDGTFRHCFSAPTALMLDGEVTGFAAIVLDVTDRKLAEEELRRSEARFAKIFSSNPAAMAITRLDDGRLTDVNGAWQRLTGFSQVEAVGRTPVELDIWADPAERERMVADVRERGSWRGEVSFRDRTGRSLNLLMSAELIELGGERFLATMAQDMTDIKLAEEALRSSERRFRLLAENAGDMIYRVRLLPRLAVEYVSPSALAITGYSPEEYYAEPVLGFGLIPFEGHPEHEGAAWARDLASGPRTMRWQRKDGGTVWLELLNHPVLNAAGRLVAIEGVARNVTERKRAEDALRESEEKFRDLAEQSPNMIFINCRGKVVYANRRCVELMGYKRDEFYAPDFDFWTLAAPECRKLVAEKYGAHLSGREVAPYECAFTAKAGSRIDAILSTKIINYGGERALLGTITDITERKGIERALRDSEDRYRRLFESAPQGIVTLDLEGTVMDVNLAALKMMNLRREEVVGRHLAEISGAAADLPALAGQLARFLQGEAFERLEVRIPAPQGDVWQEVFPAIVEKDGEPQGIQIMMRDITASKLADESIRASLREKEVLLKEIHHRVKNNLQIIHSLLNMQARKVRDGRVIEALRESQNRVRTMALIHERLYRSTDLSEIDMREYIGRLAGELHRTYSPASGKVELVLDLEDVKLGIDKAIPCGFIVNELVSNSLKHAFAGRAGGELLLSLSRDSGGAVRLGVRDDGPGLPEGLDFRRTESLGLQLVCALVDQLQGTIERAPGAGTSFVVSFRPDLEEA